MSSRLISSAPTLDWWREIVEIDVDRVGTEASSQAKREDLDRVALQVMGVPVGADAIPAIRSIVPSGAWVPGSHFGYSSTVSGLTSAQGS